MASVQTSNVFMHMRPAARVFTRYALPPCVAPLSLPPSIAQANNVQRLDGLPMGIRLLLGLASTIATHGGQDALSKAVLVLNMRADQLEAVRGALLARKMAGFTPANVLLTVQPPNHGYAWLAEETRFVRDPASPSCMGLGSGYSLMQLAHDQVCCCGVWLGAVGLQQEQLLHTVVAGLQAPPPPPTHTRTT